MPDAQKQPSVLTIICDQLSPHVLSCYGGPVHTPNIDRIASSGVLFTDTTCPTPVCSPSRASLATGLYPHTHGITMNISSVPGIQSGETTTDLLLNKAGYSTHYLGKWHLEDKGKLPAYYPESYRYDYEWRKEMQPMFDELLKGDPWAYMDHYHLVLPVEVEPAFKKIAQKVAPSWKDVAPVPFYELALKMGRLKLDHGEHVDVRVVDKAITALESVPQDKPFAITCSIQAPHDPNVIHSPYYEMFDPKKIDLPSNRNVREERFDLRGWRTPARKVAADLGEAGVREFTRIYYGSVKMIDDEVGRILAALDKSGRAKDTIIVFTADHGDMLGGHGMVTKSMDGFYEEVVNVPLIIAHPSLTKARKSTAPTCITDIAPTLLELTGQSVPKQMQGLSLADHLTGKPSKLDSRRFTFSERIANNPEQKRQVQPGTAANFMIRGHGWKYACFHDRDEHLFDLTRDPGEMKNLVGDKRHADTLERLRVELDYWIASTGCATELKRGRS